MGTLVLHLFLAVLAVQSVLTSENLGVPVALAFDDICQVNATEGHCAISALQVRSSWRSDPVLLEPPEPFGMKPFMSGSNGMLTDAIGGSCAGAYEQCGGIKWAGPLCCPPDHECISTSEEYSECAVMNSTSPGSKNWVYRPSRLLKRRSSAPVFTFYMYRVSGSSIFPPLNVNTGNLPGIMWYLHNEVVYLTPRKFGISKITRYKVSTRATEVLHRRNMNFGVRYAFDSGQCTGPFNCNEQFAHYGFFVGCNKLGDFPFPQFRTGYPDGIWYSLPGACSSRRFNEWTTECKTAQPGGYCRGTPSGRGDCTYTYKYAGEVTLDELEGIRSYEEFRRHGGREYMKDQDRGNKMSFWDGVMDEKKNRQRVKAVEDMFMRKYPRMRRSYSNPRCDFSYHRFFER